MEIKEPINMKEVREGSNMEEHYKIIADKIDEYHAQDKDFMLWYLLGNYRLYLDTMLEKRNYDVQSISDYAERRLMMDHLKWSEDIRNLLQEVIF